jgi:tol-pal system protein YbgF
VIRARWALAGVLALGGCASQGAVTRLQTDVGLLSAETARRDSALASQLSEVIDIQRRMFDTLAATREGMRGMRGDMQNDLYGVQQQLVQLQELTGQSQRRLSELRTQLEVRGEQIQADSARPAQSGGAGPGGAATPSGPSAEQMYQTSLQQLRRGSASTARAGLQAMLQQYPQHERAPDALYFVGESFSAQNADSSAAYYTRVVSDHPQSARASTALYKLGLIAERRKDLAAARDAYGRVVQAYPRSDEAALARDRLKTLGR